MYSVTVYESKDHKTIRVVAGDHVPHADCENYSVRIYQGGDHQQAIDAAYAGEELTGIREIIARFGITEKAREPVSEKPCGYSDCKNTVTKYGRPGVAMSRYDNKTLICSQCGLLEAFGNKKQSRLRAA